jgi:apolipoprotein D and lipocalin family protein
MLPPDSSSRSRVEPVDLDARILLVEQRLIAREQTLRRGIADLGQRLRATHEPWRRALPALGLALAAVTLAAIAWRWRRRARPHRHAVPALAAAPHAAAAAAASTAGSDIPWVRLVALGWPLLPARWRSRVSPATASSLVALGLPLVEWLLHGRKLPPPATAPAVDWSAFAGTWFVLARLRRAFGSPLAPGATIRYALRRDGHLDVTSRGAAPGLAHLVPGSGGAKLVLSRWPAWLRWLPLAWNDHWILHVDRGYGEALVGSPDRRQLLVLARTPGLAPLRHGELMQVARERRYPLERLELPRAALPR